MRISNWHYVYVLQSSKDWEWYVGYTQYLKARLKAHSAEKSFATKGRLPFTLVYVEAGRHQRDAQRRERYLKTTQGRRFLKLRLKEYRHS